LTALTKPAKKAERLFTIAVIVIWAIAFGIYFVNKPDPSLLGLSTAYAYSLLWWVVAILAFIAYAIYDLSKGG
jgi:hypothetical protein